jgi:hypothetical protein
MNFTKDDFISVLSALQDQYDYDKARTEKLQQVYNSDIQPSDNSRLTNQLFKLLHKQFPPNGDFCEIQHFCYELDFGRSSGSDINALWESLINKTK